MSDQLKGKIAVITGGSTGLGLATAERFVKEGAYVFITGRRQAELDAAVKKIGGNVTALQGDVTKLADLDRIYAEVKKQKGRIDVLFANAGFYDFKPLSEVTEEHYDKMFDINVKGLVFTVQKALPLLVDGASVILNASVVANKGLENASIYSATKAAVRNLARGWTNDLKARKIRVNALSPGMVPTEGFGTNFNMTEEQIKELSAQHGASVPAGRTGFPPEIAAAALFLASSESSYITGFDLVVDGGMAQV